MSTITMHGASLPSSAFEGVRDGGWSIESQLARVHYCRSGRRYGLTYAELLLRALEIASETEVEREICARLSLFAYYSPDMVEHAERDAELANAIAEKRRGIREEMRAEGGHEIETRAAYAIEVAIKVYFDEARDSSRRREPSREHPVLYFEMEYGDAFDRCASAFDRLGISGISGLQGVASQPPKSGS